ncbi:MAG: hypothetical protein HN742_08050 [Lentisphaerae bacterium]|nr:hypothetical protein [Lentisphaerota bacterium]MBT4817003.1 hypothetical protein [Lentisphaerota bacterium]MBT5604705.1 hypothetical protein [Lentisphaerota bacterium]MBT7058121.1 hypothetical protein [Lentisphaerota bacterium]MBT7841809.1 hypothetical protein [Lentisphaerota bacterium]
MKRRCRYSLCLLATVALMGFIPLRSNAAEPQSVPAEDIEKMQKALPDASPTVPASPRRVLVFGKCRGFFHGSIPWGAESFAILGRKTGVFEAVVADDESVFEADSLARFDAILFNNATGELFHPGDLSKLPESEQKQAVEREARRKKNVLEFVRGGKGIIGVHAATDCSYKWEDYGKLIGGYFSGHPWHEDVTVKVDDPAHPLCAAFKGQSFVIKDEIYQFRDPYSRDTLRVLLSLDTGRTNMNKGNKIKRKDDDFAVAWIQEIGKGRVFYCSLGHRNEIFWNRPVMQFYLAGIQYALGDLTADATPSSRLSASYVRKSREQGREAGLDAMFKDILVYEMGVDDSSAKLITAQVIAAQKTKDKTACEELARRLSGVLDDDASDDCKRFACRQLAIVGNKASVPALARLLLDDELAHMARHALERIPGRNVDIALREAAVKASGRTQEGIINSLGARGSTRAVPTLIPLLSLSDTASASAAAAALGKIGGSDALKALQDSRSRAHRAVIPAIDRALLQCADVLRGKRGFIGTAKRKARGTYDLLLSQSKDDGVKAAAFYGATMLAGAEGVRSVIAVLAEEGGDMQRAAARLVRDLPGKDTAIQFGAYFASIAGANRPTVLDALAERGDSIVLPVVLKEIGSEDDITRLAALRALQFLGNYSAVMPLALTAAAAEDKSAVRNTARRSLDRMTSLDIDPTIAAAVSDTTGSVQIELIRALGARKTVAAVPALLKQARSEDRDVRKESLKALGLLASTTDRPALVKLLIETKSGTNRSELQNIVTAINRRMKDQDARGEVILASLVTPPEAASSHCALLSCLGGIASPNGLPALYGALKNKNSDVRKAAIRALADWPDPSPLEQLRVVSRESEDLVERVLSLRGYARQLAMPSERPIRKTLGLYREALGLAQNDQEKKPLLAGLGDICHPDALTMLEPFFDVPAIQTEALMSATRIYQGLDGAAMTATASHGQKDTKKALDGTRDTRWTTGGAMKGGEWYQVDVGFESTIKTIYLDAGPVGTDYPRGYEVYVGLDPEKLGKPRVVAKGKERIFTITLDPPVYGQFIKIVQTGSSTGNFWSIAEMKINGRPLNDTSAELDRSGWKMSASHMKDAAGNAIDGDREKRWGTGGAQKGGEWLQVDMGEEKTVRKVILDAAKSRSDYPQGYQVYVSSDGENWIGPIAVGGGSKALTTITCLPRKGRYVRIKQTGNAERWWWSVYDLRIVAE